MKSIKIFFIQLIILYKLFSKELIFCETGESDADKTKAREFLGSKSYDTGKTEDELELEKQKDDTTSKEFGERKTGDEETKDKTKEKPAEGEEKKEEKKADEGAEEKKSEPGVVKLGGKEIDQQVFEKLYEEAKKDYGDEFDSLSDTMKQKILEKTAKGKDEKREIDKTHQRQAAKDKELEEAEGKVSEKQAKLKEMEDNFVSRKAELEKLVKDLPKKIEEEADKYENQKKVNELELDLRDAKKELANLTKKVRVYDIEGKAHDLTPEEAIEFEKQKLELERQTNFYIAAKASLLDAFADDFKTSIPLEELNDEPGAGTKEDRRILRKFKNVYDDYMGETTPKERKTYTLAQFYEEERDRYPVIKREESKSKAEEKKGEEKVTSARELFKKLSGGEAPPPTGVGGKVTLGQEVGDETEGEKEMSKKAKEMLRGKREKDYASPHG